MCGICGFYSSSNKILEADLQAMAQSLLHRGPDAEGFFSDAAVGLGHKRLSIIDLSEAANQPMTSHSDRYEIVYNGEVYNYREIAKELDMQFKTSSDTEVVLEAYSKWGAKCLEKFNGMFAFAIYDKHEKTLFLARDRMGIKPLFYYWDGENFAFASELKALLKIELVKNKKVLNKAAIATFLHLGYIPEPMTIYGNIYKFPSGKHMVFSGGKVDFTEYWKVEDNINSDVINELDEAKTQLKELLTSSVKYRLISDVSYGTFLSGGTDSSLITAIAQHETSNPIKTFTIGFEESKYNEAPHANAIAKHLGTDHQEYILTYKDAIQLIEQMITVNDEPFADSSAIPTMLVSKMAKQKATMVLSGDGGDELFFGYGSYRWAQRLQNPLMKSTRKPLALALSQLPNRYKRIAQLLQYSPDDNLKSHIFSQEQYFFSQREITEMMNPEYPSAITFMETNNTRRELTPAEDQALFDIKNYLKDDLLVKVDRASMQYSLEVRVPFLDHRIVNFGLNLSPELKYHNGTSKYLLKSILYDYIPKEFFDRSKWGFSIPLNVWLKEDLKYLIDDYLSEEMIGKYSIVKYAVVRKLKEDFFRGHDYLYNRLWSLIVLHKWLSGNIS
ncbi:MAG: asparagine synthase (glutamine-hydrolyzing) [Flavobacteriales bacterium]|nr:asparagine synthase (glutamine-hydrolyzing) [Flavobacteriales bacterium]